MMPLPWKICSKRFATRKTVQSQLAGTHASLSIHVLGIFNHDLGRAAVKPGLSDADLGPEGNRAVLYHTVHAMLARLSHIGTLQRFAR